jgi:polyisoprenoid-binding protein YceI
LSLLLIGLAQDPASAQAVATYRVAPTESSVRIHVGAAGLFGFLGHEHEIAAPAMSGAIEVDRTELTRSTVAVEFQASALKVTGRGEPAADVPDVQRTMQGQQVLDVEHHPSISFRSREIVVEREVAGRMSVIVRGDLTLRGVTRPVDVTGTVVLVGDTVTMKGTARFRQTDFGLRPVTAAGGTVRVKDQLDVEMVIVARASGR